MIELIIKTLDSQNHAFTVEDDITVAQFKEHIVEVINIPVESQRLIYCGRVLQDDKKLQDYNVNGKVVHLVQKAPPSAARRSRSPQPSPINARRVLRFDAPANAMYLGSMAFPTGFMEAQGIVPPSPIQSLSGSRLNVARRMIQRAENVLNNLENPDSNQNRESPSSDELQDEVTPVFAAQVFIPHSQQDASSASSSSQGEQAAATAAAAESSNSGAQAGPAGAEVPNAQSPTAGRLPENATGTIEMSRLLDSLNKVQERLRPFMERYHGFMRDDPAVTGEQDAQQMQALANQVSELMHLLGHAYHSLSDVIVQVSTPPPRPLLCRPILIQHSALLQAGIPIQVEAQMNFATNNNTTQSNSESSSSSESPAAGRAPAEEGAPPAPQPSVPVAQIRPNIHEIRIDSFPFALPRPPMFTVQHRAPTIVTSQPGAQPAEPATANGQPGSQGPPPPQPNVLVMPPFNNINVNPNMEFFMEVTPDGITIDSLNATIDSLDATVVTSAAQSDNAVQGAFDSPEFLNSILQAVAGQMMGEVNAAHSQAAAAPPATAADPRAPDGGQVSSTPTTAGANASNVNSQARGNTQTHPTTSTQTRSTSRPHVQLAQHTMQGFDPFLPCNSHHIRRRRGHGNATTTSAAAAAAAAASSEHEQPASGPTANTLYNVFQGLFRSLGSLTRQQRERPGQQEPGAPAPAPASAPRTPTTPDSHSAFASTVSSMSTPRAPERSERRAAPRAQGLADLAAAGGEARAQQGTTLANMLQNFPDHSYTEGESLFADLMMTLARALTFGDVVALNLGQADSLPHLRPTLRTFFLERVLAGEQPCPASIGRAVDRLLDELQPVLESFGAMRPARNVDIVQSATRFCRARLPGIISLVVTCMLGTFRSLLDQFLLTMREFCALLVHSNLDGVAGVEDVFRTLVTRYTTGISPEAQEWTVHASTTYLHQFLSTLDVPPATIAAYVVQRGEPCGAEVPVTAAPAAAVAVTAAAPVAQPEQMEVDEPAAEAAPEPALDLEPLPGVVLGSEPWHRSLSARQRRQNSQPPFSDAYLSGMPSKRRKLVASAKPQGSVPQIIAEGVRQAVTASGLAGAAPLDAVAQAASADPALQAAYRELLRSSAQAGLRDNPDFCADRFPNASSYFNVKKK